MLAHIRSNAVAYLALFVALSGTAVAATALPKNSVGPRQLKTNGVTGADVKRNTLTGRHINEGRLGRVPNAANAANAGNAATVGGQAPSAFLAAGAKAADADRLDGIDSSVFGSAQTIAGVNFEPRQIVVAEKVYVGTGAITCSASDDFHYRVQLPQGARVLGLDYRFVDTNLASNSGLELNVFDTFDVGLVTNTLVLAASSGDAAGRRTASAELAAPHVVDNGRWSYQLIWSPFDCGTDTQLVGARVRYALPAG